VKLGSLEQQEVQDHKVFLVSKDSKGCLEILVQLEQEDYQVSRVHRVTQEDKVPLGLMVLRGRQGIVDQTAMLDQLAFKVQTVNFL